MGYLSTWNFLIKKETIKDVAKVLSQMKFLDSFDIGTNNDEKYYLTPEDLVLFKDIPVKMLYLHALDLTEDNVEDFRQVMRQMEIECIEGIEDFQNDGLEISEQYFGPDDRYVTI